MATIFDLPHRAEYLKYTLPRRMVEKFCRNEGVGLPQVQLMNFSETKARFKIETSFINYSNRLIVIAIDEAWDAKKQWAWATMATVHECAHDMFDFNKETLGIKTMAESDLMNVLRDCKNEQRVLLEDRWSGTLLKRGRIYVLKEAQDDYRIPENSGMLYPEARNLILLAHTVCMAKYTKVLKLLHQGKINARDLWDNIEKEGFTPSQELRELWREKAFPLAAKMWQERNNWILKDMMDEFLLLFPPALNFQEPSTVADIGGHLGEAPKRSTNGDNSNQGKAEAEAKKQSSKANAQNQADGKPEAGNEKNESGTGDSESEKSDPSSSAGDGDNGKDDQNTDDSQTGESSSSENGSNEADTENESGDPENGSGDPAADEEGKTASDEDSSQEDNANASDQSASGDQSDDSQESNDSSSAGSNSNSETENSETKDSPSDSGNSSDISSPGASSDESSGETDSKTSGSRRDSESVDNQDNKQPENENDGSAKPAENAPDPAAAQEPAITYSSIVSDDDYPSIDREEADLDAEQGAEVVESQIKEELDDANREARPFIEGMYPGEGADIIQPSNARGWISTAAPYVPALSRELKVTLQPRVNEQSKMGRLNIGRMVRFPDTDNPFDSKNSLEMDAGRGRVLTVIGDTSGSMKQGGKIHAMKVALMTTHLTCRQVEMQYRILTSRTLSVLASSEMSETNCLGLIAGLSQHSSGDNYLVTLPLLLNELNESQKTADQIVVVITDGQPSGIAALSEIVDRYRNLGFLIVGLGLNLSSNEKLGMETIFGKEFTIHGEIGTTGSGGSFAEILGQTLTRLVRMSRNH